MSELTIVEHTRYDDEIGRYDELLAALKQVTEYEHHPEQVERLLASDTARLFLGYLGDRAVASTVLVGPYETMSKRVAIIEDVAVLHEARRRGIGSQMVQHAVDVAQMDGADVVQLHSNPDSRPGANAMYAELGFRVHETNVFVRDM